MQNFELPFLRERAACGTGFIAQLGARPTHALLQDALTTVSRLAHRGAVSADARTGDGAGILTPIPRELFAREFAQRGLDAPDDFAVGMFFLPRTQHARRERAKQIIADALAANGLTLLTWRNVPIDANALGEHARAIAPQIEQAIIARTASVTAGAEFERALFLARKAIERAALATHIEPLYVASLSARTLVYKGLFVAPQLAKFYLDLDDPLYTIHYALFHQRYSTNTFPTWERAQPFRMLCHNGEINTIQANVAWMRAREPHLASPIWGSRIREISPVLDLSGSDSGIIDNALEMLALSGYAAPQAMMTLIPEAWENVSDIPPAWRAFYHYQATLMEPWDGPAAIAFADGRTVGMSLDRNGLRPARYLITHDGLIVAASEAGALEVDPARVIEKGKLGPGQMLVVDLEQNQVLHNAEIKNFYANQHPYAEWLAQQIVTPETLPAPENYALKDLQRWHTAFGYTDEELVVVLRPMATNAAEPTGSMGDDTPHAILSTFDRPLYHFFKQRFAQVTNPPLDPLREELVMSTRVSLGAAGNLLDVAQHDQPPTRQRLLEISSPILTRAQLLALRAHADEFPFADLDATFATDTGDLDALEKAITDLEDAAERAVDAGAVFLIMSDHAMTVTRAPIPMLLAVSAVHQRLMRAGKRWQVSIITETGDARDVHQFACLIGYGANALQPYLALASVHALAEHHLERTNRATATEPTFTPERATENYLHAVEKGLHKIMSKMGIATLDAYHGGQIFEVIGLAEDVVARYFTGTPAHVGGLGLRDIGARVIARHARAYANAEPPPYLKNYGFFKYKKDGEHHAYNPAVVQTLQAAVRTPRATGDNFAEAYAKYKEYVSLVHANSTAEISDHLDLVFGTPIPLDRVEPVSAILERFSGAAMSHGALSLEAHELIATALNRIGVLTNSGEGGEDPKRYASANNSRIKQVASARFGVTPAYLMSADELQIKMAQGSKPGEGGQLPAHKVTAEIAAVRHTLPGTPLISPPPHHDIYSIEDLAQLIYDLKRINPRARVSVKLVAQAGVGTIAAGVAKAFADVIQISGHSGGTGASPLSSIKHAGVAWELGLAETQQVLVANDLRARVRIRVDGGLKTARHVIVAALLGADEFSFGTGALIASGCIMARVCHTNTCPTGIATQNEALRKKFPNEPEWVIAYFTFLAEETREYLAALGCQSLEELIGRVERLRFARRAARANPMPLPEQQWAVAGAVMVE